MPPKKTKKPSKKPKRIPHANETPLKDKQPGHGAVERAKNNMWSSSSTLSSSSTAPTAAVRPQYKVSSVPTAMKGIVIGRGAGIKKKKKAIPSSAATGSAVSAAATPLDAANGARTNPDMDFFSK